MNYHYIVLRNRRGIGWVADGPPASLKTARSRRDEIRSLFGRGQAILVQVLDK